MIPSALARQLELGLTDFLRLSFWSSTPGMSGMVDRMLDEPGAVFKGPYVSVKLPFVAGATAAEPFPRVPLGFPPHAHQEQAFDRLSGPTPRSTLVATGTGSGKTESFLWPILEHCRQTLGTPGIKAILIYPMNALATDQAQRLARAIHRTPSLANGVRAGLYIGEGRGSKAGRHGVMGPDHLITDREVMQNDPPHILLTNYKMLDYLLVRPRDQGLWRHNLGGPLRFLVVDELHTFDGAQGTDLACLIRRLKARLDTPPGTLCAIGTSATLGGGDDAADTLRDYATKVFGEPFEPGSVVSERRQTPAAFFGDALLDYEAVHPDDPAALDAGSYPDPDSYLLAQQALWFSEPPTGPPLSDPWRVSLGHQLRTHPFFHNLVRVLVDGPETLHDLAARMDPRGRSAPALVRARTSSLLALIAAARSWLPEREDARLAREATGAPPRTTPFLEVRLQLWQRELARLVADVSATPRLTFSDDLSVDDARRHLPVVHCRECGAMGWAASTRKDKPGTYQTPIKGFYRKYFANDPDVVFLWPEEGSPTDGLWSLAHRFWMHTPSLTGTDLPDGLPADELLAVVSSPNTHTVEGKQVLHKDCPHCAAHNSLTLVGFRAATLTSVFLDQLFASRFNDDKKLLTFSDSVQDAAHRAGFFGARTWRFNLRVATRHTLKTAGPLTLEQLPEAVTHAWRQALGDDAFVATFLPPNMNWKAEYEHLLDKGKLPPSSALPDLVGRRIAFELHTELGHQARVGRSLTRTGSVSVALDESKLTAACAEALTSLQEHVGGLRELTLPTVLTLARMSLHHLRERGGILHNELPSLFVEAENTFAFTQRDHLPNFGPTSRLPALLTDALSAQHHDRLFTKTDPGSWYEATWRKLTRSAAVLVGAPRDGWPLLLRALVHHGVLLERAGDKGTVWGIAPGALQVELGSVRLSCPTCRHWLRLAPSEVGVMGALPCLQPQCDGVYAVDPSEPVSHFGALYADGEVCRVFTAEHTGLLERDAREELEQRFKSDGADRRIWYPNLLSCTSTLEMGIDIGALSSAVLCSVPPAQANYLQRIGRTGRRDGNSLLLTIATARPHDLYFYADPPEMLDGDVQSPGVYLRASAVLERQLTAFTLDQWNKTGVTPDAIPGTLAEVLPHLDPSHAHRFPHTWLRSVEQRGEHLLSAFHALFDDQLDDDVRTHLTHFLFGNAGDEGSLIWKVLDLLRGEKGQRDALDGQRLAAIAALEAIQAHPAKAEDHDERVSALEAEIEALASLVKAIDDTHTLAFLTDQGLLPNYAFPESAIRLRSVIWRKRANPKGNQKAYDTRSFEYQRPGMSAITELAPGNQFYAGGRRVQISRVDVRTAKVEACRFCASCSYCHPIKADDVLKSCPNCGSGAFGEPSQRRELLRLQQVFARTPDRTSRIADEADERQPRFYNRDLLLSFDDPDRGAAWSTNQQATPFAFEYLRRVTFREFNFGESADQGTAFSIAGREEVRQGFTICRECGTVQPRPKGKQAPKPEHTVWCSARQENAKNADYQTAVYLYREFASEAIRMLLPLSDLGSTEQLNSFVAAFQLGLRSLYGGQVGHIQTAVYSEPEVGTMVRRQYLVLHDTVPGGTGYLKDLMKQPGEGGPPVLITILQRAVDHLAACVCQTDPDKDGCYACLYAYRNSRDMEDTSARRALELFGRILADQHKLERVPSLSSISVSGLMDSVLEARFIEALRQLRPGNQPMHVEKRMVHGKPGFFVRAGPQDWLVEQQVDLGRTQGVHVPTRADFVFYEGERHDGAGPHQQARRIAIYLDGFAYHRHQTDHDWLQRMHLLDAGYDVWTFTWQDVDAAFHSDVDDPPFFLHGNLDELRAGLTLFNLGPLARTLDEPSMRRFARELSAPLPWRDLAFAALACQLDPQADTAAWSASLAAHLPSALASLSALTPGSVVGQRAGAGWRLWFALPAAGLATLDASLMRVVLWLDDHPDRHDSAEYRADWWGAHYLAQSLRVLPDVWLLTRQGGTRADYSSLLDQRSHAGADGEDDPWSSLQVEPSYASVVKVLAAHLHELPDVGVGLPDSRSWDSGVVAELAWEERRVAIVDDDVDTSAVSSDWKIFRRAAVLASPTSLFNALPGDR